MGKDPDRIRQEIEEQREQMGGTVEALSYKMDVKERAKDKVHDVASKPKDALMRAKDSVLGTKDTVVGTVGDRTPGKSDFKAGGRKVGRVAVSAKDTAVRNPLGLAIGGIAVGFLAGLATPTTRLEDEKLGGIAEDVKDAVKSTGSEALERGKDVAQDALAAAKDTVAEQGKQQGKQLASSAKGAAKQAAPGSSSAGSASSL